MGSSFVVFPTSRVVRKDTSYEKSLNESQQINDCKNILSFTPFDCVLSTIKYMLPCKGRELNTEHAVLN